MSINKYKINVRVIMLMVSILLFSLQSCNVTSKLNVQVYETSASGNSLTKITQFTNQGNPVVLTINPEEKFQTITGFGGSFTESSAYLLNKLGKENRNKILNAYFSEAGANYSLTRTHIASCDFSLNNYTSVSYTHLRAHET
jgi:glucosylceramidase